MFNINVDVNALREKNNRLKAIASSLEGDVNAVVAAANNVSTGWTGTNSDEYVNAFNEFKPKMDAKVNAIKATTTAIDNTIQRIVEAQERIRRETDALPQ